MIEANLRIHHGFMLKRARENGAYNEALSSVVNARRSCNYSNPTGHLSDALISYYDYFGTYPPEGMHDADYLVSPEEVHHHGRLTAAINRYLSLSKDANLKLTTHGEDWVCKSYCHKSHCSIETVFTSFERNMGVQLATWKKKHNIQGRFFVREGFEDSDFFILTTVGTFWAVMDSIKSTNQVFVSSG